MARRGWQTSFSESYVVRVRNGQIPLSGSLSSGSAYCFAIAGVSVESDIGMNCIPSQASMRLWMRCRTGAAIGCERLILLNQPLFTINFCHASFGDQLLLAGGRIISGSKVDTSTTTLRT